MFRVRYLALLAALILAGCSIPKPPASEPVPIVFPTIHGN